MKVASNVINNISITEFFRHIDQNILVSNAQIEVIAVAKNGKKKLVSIGASVVITSDEEKKNIEPEKFQALKKIKEKMGINNVIDFLEDMLINRVGVKGHRGYFKFQELLPADDEHLQMLK